MGMTHIAMIPARFLSSSQLLRLEVILTFLFSPITLNATLSDIRPYKFVLGLNETKYTISITSVLDLFRINIYQLLHFRALSSLRNVLVESKWFSDNLSDPGLFETTIDVFG